MEKQTDILSDPRIIRGLKAIPDGLSGLFISLEGGEQTYFVPDLPGYEDLQFEILGYLHEVRWQKEDSC